MKNTLEFFNLMTFYWNSIFITLTPINDKYRKEDTGPVTSLTNQDIERFSRHLLMEEIGMKGTDAIILKVFLILK